jgi:hypothetical protein
MSRITYGQKVHTALSLLMGLRDPGISAALPPHGLTEAVLQDGWDRLRTVTHLPRPVELSASPDIVKQLDGLENRWFPMARYTLQFRYPELGRSLFDGLSQASGAAVLISADLFVSRVEQLAAGEEPFGEQGPEAREALRERGLTDEVLGQMRSLVAKAQTFKAPAVRMPDPTERQAAVDHLWAWYREWAGVARIALKNRTHLRMLGLRKPRRAASAVDAEFEVVALPDAAETPALPEGAAPTEAASGSPTAGSECAPVYASLPRAAE